MNLMKMFVYIALLYDLKSGNVDTFKTVAKCQYRGALSAQVWLLSNPFPTLLFLDDAIVEEDVTSNEYSKQCTGVDGIEIIAYGSDDRKVFWLPKYLNRCDKGEAK